MKISETLDYPAEPDVVFAMLTDERFQARKCEEAGALAHDVAVTQVGGGSRVVTRRELPTENLPDFAKSLIGPRLVITETYEWEALNGDGSRPGDLTIELGGAPVTMRAGIVLAPVGTGTQLHIDGTLKASVPLIGRKIEKSAAPAIIDGIRSDGTLGRVWLSEQR
ncbi:MAG: DUF2505 domain-containing protein [Intrasporangium sp.]|uniref:DUF2505 domain-containing protein n=1 Tax=Intrasporangium sp. TaxID=1925024 RepID=UPI0026491BEC|nr:DUF2505 domain-containing protein [Intrasporangium sp.]MDN5795564.1 DUF2505 domain-containing protein [Intrasporangium sp.]